ncbi:MAG TPA: LacI family DNA-binding transcriptional regulator [Spirochaetia bacterium]|nr:LacI family DNA-binding transcriptional regulator [Spirochaetia bacterium]
MAKTEELVRLSGVSRSTVFRFLRGDNVRPEARIAILEAMGRLNIRHEDHSVHKNTTLLISIRPDFKVFKGYDLSINGFIEKADSYGFRVELKTGSSLAAIEGGKNAPPPAGVLILGKPVAEEEEESALLRKAHIPHVFVNRMFDDLTYSWVSVNHREAAREAVSHLFGLGHREVGTWGVTSSYRIDRDKRIGYQAVHAERNLPIPDSCLDFDRHGDLEVAIQALIDEGRLPSAWFAASDEHAMRFIKVARENNIRVPEDVAIVGMDDVGLAEYLNPPLTTIHIPFREAGAAALECLRHLIENPTEDAIHMVMKYSLVIRESCGSKSVISRTK